MLSTVNSRSFNKKFAEFPWFILQSYDDILMESVLYVIFDETEVLA